MPCLTWPLTDDPTLAEPRHDATLAAAQAWLPQGAYTTLRSYGREGLLRLDSHLQRLEETMALLGYPWQAERPRLRRQLCAALRAVPWAASGESRLRLTVDGADAIGALWLSIEPLPTPDPEQQQQGVAALTARMQRENPRAKDNAFIAASAAARARLGGRLNEVLMVDEQGDILEGLSSNFFAVRDGTLYTAEAGVLPGITRSLVLEQADALGLPTVRQAVPLTELARLDEAFISSTSRDILPLVEVDDLPIGSGQPGPVTRRLMRALTAAIEAALDYPCAG